MSEGIAWVTALKNVSLRALVEQGHLKLGLFDQSNLVELNPPDYPGEPVVACRNPELAKLRAHKCEDLLTATERNLAPIKVRVAAGKLTDADAIGLRVGKVTDQYKVAKHFAVEIGEHALTFAHNAGSIAAEAAHSFATLVTDPVTIVRSTCRTAQAEDTAPSFDVLTTLTAKQTSSLALAQQTRMYTERSTGSSHQVLVRERELALRLLELQLRDIQRRLPPFIDDVYNDRHLNTAIG